MSKEIKRLFDFAYFQLENYDLEKSLVSKKDGKWEVTSSRQFIEKANQISKGLLSLGIKPNDKIAIISTSNRTEWNILDVAVLQIGAINVPIYPTSSKENYEYIFNHAEVVLCFLSDEELFKKANAIKENVPTLKDIYSFDHIKKCKNWDEVAKLGKGAFLKGPLIHLSFNSFSNLDCTTTGFSLALL